MAGPDLSTREGAERLVRRIKGYWKRRGCRVDADVEEVLSNVKGGSVWVVRSDIINGAPPKTDDGDAR